MRRGSCRSFFTRIIRDRVRASVRVLVRDEVPAGAGLNGFEKRRS